MRHSGFGGCRVGQAVQSMQGPKDAQGWNRKQQLIQRHQSCVVHYVEVAVGDLVRLQPSLRLLLHRVLTVTMQSFGPDGNVSSQAPPTADGWDVTSTMQGAKTQGVAWDLVNELLWSLSDSVSEAHWRYHKASMLCVQGHLQAHSWPDGTLYCRCKAHSQSHCMMSPVAECVLRCLQLPAARTDKLSCTQRRPHCRRGHIPY